MTFELDNKYLKRLIRQRLFDPLSPTQRLGRQEIESLIPHRDDMLLLDQITALDLTKGRIEAVRLLHINNPGFPGHFPGHSIYPGVLQIEMGGQLSLCLEALLSKENSDSVSRDISRSVRLFKVHYAVFAAELHPGDEVTVLAEIMEDNGVTMIAVSQLLKNSQPVSFAVVEAVHSMED